MSDKDYRGRFLWYDLNTTDPAGALAFYTEVVGWKTEAWADQPEGATPYTMFVGAGGPVGGVVELPQQARDMGAPPHWIAYVGTPDVDATLAKAKELGGNVLMAIEELEGVGRFAAFQDPHGAVIAAFTPAQAPEDPDQEVGPGDFSWHDLAAGDAAGAWTFYEALFGWKKGDSMESPSGPYQMFNADGATPLGGMFTKPDEMPAPPHWLFYARVDDVDAAAERVKQNGGQVLNGPMGVPGGDRVVQCMDPQGAAFALHSKAKA